MVDRFARNMVPHGPLPGNTLDGDVTRITGVCLELAAAMLDGAGTHDKSERRLREAAAEWAREGIPVETIHHAVHEGLKMVCDQISSDATGGERGCMVEIARRLLDIGDLITSTVALSYLDELRRITDQHDSAVRTLASALLGGYSTSAMARGSGISIAQAYHVCALSIPLHRDEYDPAFDSSVVARRKLGRVQAEITTRCGNDTLTLLGAGGGTVLIPDYRFTDENAAELVEHLSDAARVPIRMTQLHTSTGAIARAVDQAHELLDIVHRLELGAGLYRFEDLALEYQLTRPGPAREHLGAVLDPLDDSPELLKTLRLHISNNHNRRRTARHLHVHANTVDYRLKRIGQLTGFDPGEVKGLWYLRSALVARSYRRICER